MLAFEKKSQPLAPAQRFRQRLLLAGGLWLGLTLGGLVVGMAGYILTEGMSPIDAFVNAAMILSGMGPMGELKTVAGKIFAGTYAILSGLLIVISASFILAPIAHRVLHAFHVEDGRAKD